MKLRGLAVLPVLFGLGALGAGVNCGVSIETGTGGYGGVPPTVVVASSSGGFTSSTTGGLGGAGGGGVAATCASDTDCAPGLLCLQDTASDPVFGGGPAGGFCTRVCSGDVDCPDPGGTCFKLDPGLPGRCTLSCTLGPPITSIPQFFGPLDPSKCRGREDLRCGKTKDGASVCLPTCGEDAQCHGGRVCDPRLAVCVDHPNDGQPLGAPCDPNASPTTCGGMCVGFDSGIAMCSSPCVLGGQMLQTSDCGGPERGLCAFRAQPNGPGDGGFCTPSCDQQEDCPLPSFWCHRFAGVSDAVHKGYCFVAAPCPGGQGDCIAANDTNDVCTMTAFGPFCLDPTFPLGGSGGAGGSAP